MEVRGGGEFGRGWRRVVIAWTLYMMLESAAFGEEVKSTHEMCQLGRGSRLLLVC